MQAILRSITIGLMFVAVGAHAADSVEKILAEYDTTKDTTTTRREEMSGGIREVD